MAKIEVTLSEITGAANKIQKASEDFLSVAGQAMASAESLAETWEGDSQVAFMQEQKTATEWYTQMMSLVSTYVANLREAVKLYGEADTSSADEIRKC